MSELSNKYTVSWTQNGWGVIHPEGAILCATGWSEEDKKRAEHYAAIFSVAGDDANLPRQAEISLEAIGTIYDTANQMIGKYEDDESVLEDMERFREISGAALYRIYHAPHLKPEQEAKEAQ